MVPEVPAAAEPDMEPLVLLPSLVEGWSPVIGAAPLAEFAAPPVAPTASEPDRLLVPPPVWATAVPARLRATKAAVR